MKRVVHVLMVATLTVHAAGKSKKIEKKGISVREDLHAWSYKEIRLGLHTDIFQNPLETESPYKCINGQLITTMPWSEKQLEQMHERTRSHFQNAFEEVGNHKTQYRHAIAELRRLSPEKLARDAQDLQIQISGLQGRWSPTPERQLGYWEKLNTDEKEDGDPLQEARLEAEICMSEEDIDAYEEAINDAWSAGRLPAVFYEAHCKYLKKLATLQIPTRVRSASCESDSSEYEDDNNKIEKAEPDYSTWALECLYAYITINRDYPEKKEALMNELRPLASMKEGDDSELVWLLNQYNKRNENRADVVAYFFLQNAKRCAIENPTFENLSVYRKCICTTRIQGKPLPDVFKKSYSDHLAALEAKALPKRLELSPFPWS